MKLMLDQRAIQSINLFQNLTGSSVVDCLIDDGCIYFVVKEGQYGLTVGKGGIKIKNAERVFKKTIKVFEYAPTLEEFLRKIMPVQEITSAENIVYVKVDQKEKSKVIGKAGKNIKILNKVVQRLYDIQEIKIR